MTVYTDLPVFTLKNERAIIRAVRHTQPADGVNLAWQLSMQRRRRDALRNSRRCCPRWMSGWIKESVYTGRAYGLDEGRYRHEHQHRGGLLAGLGRAGGRVLFATYTGKSNQAWSPCRLPAGFWRSRRAGQHYLPEGCLRSRARGCQDGNRLQQRLGAGFSAARIHSAKITGPVVWLEIAGDVREYDLQWAR